ncbi:hypothetical protein OC834_000066 [Tilletia horrida]|nr:hypothetical protein OC834_000066 [Tilletia horrida]
MRTLTARRSAAAASPLLISPASRRPTAAAATVAAARMSTSAPAQQATHGGGKLKTHMGTKKRFFPVGSVEGMFKRGKAGKSHLNSHMSSVRRAGLRGTAITPPGQTARHLKRLLRPIL